MGFLSKKVCSFCGSEIGIFGNRSLADGNMCKNCAKRLSPYFKNRKSSTVKQIEEHLEYRLKNEADLFNFNPTLVLGSRTKIFIDENNKCFVVNNNDDYRKDNPDIIKLDQVLAVDLDINEDKEEVFKEDEEGKEISYDPPKYEYEYSFDLDIKVNSPYFDNISFELDERNRPDSNNSELYFKQKYMAEEIRHALKPSLYPKPELGEAIKQEEEWVCKNCNHKNIGNYCNNCGKPKPLLIWYCPECGKENNGNFCYVCGTGKPKE